MGLIAVVELVAIVGLAVAWRLAFKDASRAYAGWNDCVMKHNAERQEWTESSREMQTRLLAYKLERDEAKEGLERITAVFDQKCRQVSQITSIINS